MATQANAQPFGANRARPLAADGYEKFLAIAALVLLAAVLVALARGATQWGRVPPFVWLHLGTILVALGLTPLMLLGRRGDQRHRWLGRIWVVALTATALISFGIRDANDGRFSFIHALSAWTLIQAPLIWWTARTHRVARHRRAVRSMVTGALLIAGFFTFPFNRLLGQWLFG